MAEKLNIPSFVGLNVEGIPFGMVVFLQAVQDALTTVDKNVVYKDTVTVNVAPPTLRATSAQGQSFSIDGTNLASGDDYAVLCRDFGLLLNSHIALTQTVTELVKELRGSAT